MRINLRKKVMFAAAKRKLTGLGRIAQRSTQRGVSKPDKILKFFK